MDGMRFSSLAFHGSGRYSTRVGFPCGVVRQLWVWQSSEELIPFLQLAQGDDKPLGSVPTDGLPVAALLVSGADWHHASHATLTNNVRVRQRGRDQLNLQIRTRRHRVSGKTSSSSVFYASSKGRPVRGVGQRPIIKLENKLHLLSLDRAGGHCGIHTSKWTILFVPGGAEALRSDPVSALRRSSFWSWKKDRASSTNPLYILQARVSHPFESVILPPPRSPIQHFRTLVFVRFKIVHRGVGKILQDIPSSCSKKYSNNFCIFQFASLSSILNLLR